jgi:hypothetical protein
METCKCPYCGTEADHIVTELSEPSKCSKPTEHLIGGTTCLRKRLTRQSERATFLMNALGDFRCSILDTASLTAELKCNVLKRLDAAFSPMQEAEPRTNTHDWQCDACGHWNGPNLAHCAFCPRPGSDKS